MGDILKIRLHGPTGNDLKIRQFELGIIVANNSRHAAEIDLILIEPARAVREARVPAALSNGIGSQVQQPLTCVIVGGMLLSPICSLRMIPILAKLVIPRGATLPHNQARRNTCATRVVTRRAQLSARS